MVYTRSADQITRMPSGIHLSQARMIWALAGSIPAVIQDLRYRRIPNPVCGLLLGGGLFLSGLDLGLEGIEASALGVLTGFSVFLVFYLTRGMGGGDLKLMAAFGAFLGFRGILLAALIAAMAGALLALGFIAAARLRGRRSGSIPYAPAIAFGSLVVLLSHSAGRH